MKVSCLKFVVKYSTPRSQAGAWERGGKKDINQARPLLDDAAFHLNMVLDAIQPLADQDKKSSVAIDFKEPDAIFDRDEVAKRLYELLELVEIDLSESHTRLNELSRMLGSIPEIETIVEALEGYDSDKALTGIKNLADRLGLLVKEKK